MSLSTPMRWQKSHRFDRDVLAIADRHYNRQKPGTPQIAPPGRCRVFKIMECGICVAFWISSWPFAEYTRHQWAGAWMCTAFRNESRYLSSELILGAVAATRTEWPETPELGMVTFVDASKVKAKGNPGYCYLKAGFVACGETKGKLLAFQMLPSQMPEPRRCKAGKTDQRTLFGVAA